ncbi:Hypothetical protein FKW44_002725, partial [Caligus rogercresseyi]
MSLMLGGMEMRISISSLLRVFHQTNNFKIVNKHENEVQTAITTTTTRETITLHK